MTLTTKRPTESNIESSIKLFFNTEVQENSNRNSYPRYQDNYLHNYAIQHVLHHPFSVKGVLCIKQ